MADVFSCELLTFQNKIDERGGLVIAESGKEIPFEIKRVFYSFNIPDSKSRGAHAHHRCHQVLFAPSGRYKVELKDGINTRVIVMDDPLKGLHIHPGVWASEFEFEPGAICMVLASDQYDERDYIRDYDEYLKFRGSL